MDYLFVKLCHHLEYVREEESEHKEVIQEGGQVRQNCCGSAHI